MTNARSGKRKMLVKVILTLLLCLNIAGIQSFSDSPALESSSTDLELLLDEIRNVTFYFDKSLQSATTPALVNFVVYPGVVEPIQAAYLTENSHITVRIKPISAGHATITAYIVNSSGREQKTVHVEILRSRIIQTISTTVGWIYFAAWSVSFYPQIVQNCLRKSVIGLNFDFLALNLVGFSLYSIFNICLFWTNVLQDEPYGYNHHLDIVKPVQANDVLFSVHAAVACLITVCQCMMYDRGDQRMSSTCARALMTIFLFLSVSTISACMGLLPWTRVLYFCSYIKLIITLFKYVPQAFMNYRRQSTEGWSIGNIMLDFTGGTLSILQMVLISYNQAGWDRMFGNITKLGLGIISIAFDMIFFVQHYVLYNDNLQRRDRLAYKKVPIRDFVEITDLTNNGE